MATYVDFSGKHIPTKLEFDLFGRKIVLEIFMELDGFP